MMFRIRSSSLPPCRQFPVVKSGPRPPLAFSPWQLAHFFWKRTLPASTAGLAGRCAASKPAAHRRTTGRKATFTGYRFARMLRRWVPDSMSGDAAHSTRIIRCRQLWRGDDDADAIGRRLLHGRILKQLWEMDFKAFCVGQPAVTDPLMMVDDSGF